MTTPDKESEVKEEAFMEGYTQGRIVCIEQHKGIRRDEVRALMDDAVKEERTRVRNLIEGKKRLPKLYFEPDYVDDHDECVAHNKILNDVLDALEPEPNDV